MKKTLSLIIAVAVLVMFTGCTLASQETREELHSILSAMLDKFFGIESTPVFPSPSNPPETPVQTNPADTEYLWTCTIQEAKVLDIAGVTTNYAVNVSATHIGPSLDGEYAGSFDIEYDCNLGIMELILEQYIGSVTYDLDGFMKTNQLKFHVLSTDEESYNNDLNAFVNSFGTPMSDREKAIFDKAITRFGNYNPKTLEYENQVPTHFWWDWTIPSTEGDMQDFFSLSSLARGAIETYANKGQGTPSQFNVVRPILDSYHTYDYSVSASIPYTISVYNNNNVVMCFYSPDGGPLTIKFYGTIERSLASN